MEHTVHIPPLSSNPLSNFACRGLSPFPTWATRRQHCRRGGGQGRRWQVGRITSSYSRQGRPAQQSGRCGRDCLQLLPCQHLHQPAPRLLQPGVLIREFGRKNGWGWCTGRGQPAWVGRHGWAGMTGRPWASTVSGFGLELPHKYLQHTVSTFEYYPGPFPIIGP